MSENFKITGLVQQRQELDSLLISNPDMEMKVRGIIRKVLKNARQKVAEAAEKKMDSDPRHAYKAVKMAVYSKVLGGNVSLLGMSYTSGRKSPYNPPKKLRPGQRGGNRVPRGQRTQQVMDYEGADRAFILRFLNKGTTDRMAGTRGGRLSGNRGRIAPRNFFSTTSRRAIHDAASELEKMVDDLIKKELK